jgi:hypothetical protein
MPPGLHVQIAERSAILNDYPVGRHMETVETLEAIESRIIELRQEHRDLDLAIDVLEATPVHDELQLKRLKKRKLLLKDQIFFLEAQLTPDIPA